MLIQDRRQMVKMDMGTRRLPSWMEKSSFTGSQEGVYAAIRDDNMVELDRLLATEPAWQLVQTNLGDHLDTAGGWSYPLHFAAYIGNIDAVRKLLEAGADPTTRATISFREGYDATPLSLAIESGHRAIVKALWDAGGSADSMVAEATGRFSYPWLAASAGQAAIVRDLLTWKQWDLVVKLSALEEAARCWQFDVVDELLRPGVHFENDDLFPAVHEALHDAVDYRQPYHNELGPKITPVQYTEQQMLIDRLIDAGADPNFHFHSHLYGCSTLIRAARWAPDSLGAVRSLLNNGANIDLQNENGDTAFHILVGLRDWCRPAITLMLDHYANPDLNNNEGVTAIQLAAQHAPDWPELETIMETYVGGDSPPSNFDSDSDETLLHFAALGGKRETVEKLITDYDMDVNAKTKTGWTPLMFALLPKTHDNFLGRGTLHSAVRTAKLLLSHGASPLTTTDEGWTPLHALALHLDQAPDGEAKALALELISLGCPINPPPALVIPGKRHAMSEHILYPGSKWYSCRPGRENYDRETKWQKLPLLHWAALHGAIDVVKALIESGIDVFEQDMYHHTAKEVVESSEFLCERGVGGRSFKELSPVGKETLKVLDEARWRR